MLRLVAAVRPAGASPMYPVVGTPDAEGTVPEEVVSPCTQRIGKGPGRGGVGAVVRRLFRFSLQRLRQHRPSREVPA